MINLKKLFRRKKGQGALEYLFMIAAALIIIFVVVRYIGQSSSQASEQGNIAQLQSQVELIKSQAQAQGLWNTTNTTLVGLYQNCTQFANATACNDIIDWWEDQTGG